MSFSENLSFSYVFIRDRTIKVWSLDGVSDDLEQPIHLKTKATVAAHDKDMTSLAVAPNDSLVCSGSLVSSLHFVARICLHICMHTDLCMYVHIHMSGKIKFGTQGLGYLILFCFSIYCKL